MGRGRPAKTAAEHVAAGTYREDRHGPLPPTAGDAADSAWLRAELKRIKKAIAETEPGAKGYNSLIVAAGICLDKIAKLRAKEAVAEKPAVVSRPKTKLDKKGAPK